MSSAVASPFEMIHVRIRHKDLMGFYAACPKPPGAARMLHMVEDDDPNVDWSPSGSVVTPMATAHQWSPPKSDTAVAPTRIIEDVQTFLARVQQQPPIGWLIPDLIPTAGTCLWHGQPRDFKSMCAVESALALVGNRPAFAASRFTPSRAVKVAYFTEEDSEPLLAARLHWLMAKQSPLPPESFFPFVRRSLSFDVAEDRMWILDTLQAIGVEVAIFDPVRSYTGCADKGPAELRPVSVFLRKIQNETQAKSLLLVSHDTKPPAVAGDGSARSRSQQASGGGIFSISDCLISFSKTAWNQVALYPEDYKLSGDPKPFEVTFETDAHEEPGEDGPRFGSWVRPVAVSKLAQDMADGAIAKKVLAFLKKHKGTHYTTTEVNTGSEVRNDAVGPILHKLHEEGLVDFCTGYEAKALGRSPKAHLWSWPA